MVLLLTQDQMHRTVTLACGPSGIHILMGTIYTSDISW